MKFIVAPVKPHFCFRHPPLLFSRPIHIRHGDTIGCEFCEFTSIVSTKCVGVFTASCTSNNGSRGGSGTAFAAVFTMQTDTG